MLIAPYITVNLNPEANIKNEYIGETGSIAVHSFLITLPRVRREMHSIEYNAALFFSD